MKICYINMFRLFDGYYKTFKKSETFRARKKVIDEHASGMYRSLQANEKERLELAKDAKTNQAKIKELEDIFIKTRNEFQQYVNKNNQELNNDFTKFKNEILNELHDIIKTEAEQEKYDLMLDISGFSKNDIPVVLHYNKELEITENLLTRLNKGHEDEIKAIINARSPSQVGNATINPEISVK